MVVSDIPEFREQIKDGENGYIAKDNDEMYNKIVNLIENKNHNKEKFIENLKMDKKIENKDELYKLYDIIE